MPETTVKDLAAIQRKTNGRIDNLTSKFEKVVEKLSKTPAAGHPRPADAFGAPSVRKGEDTMTSRGFSFMKMIGLITGDCDRDQATVETDVADRLGKVMNSDYQPGGAGQYGQKRFLAPLATGFLPDNYVDREFRQEMKSMVSHGMGADEIDYDEMRWIKHKMLGNAFTKDLSWLNELKGGALVAPPEMGELIELLRNKEALINAGARTVPLPPQGRLKYPRQTAASNTFWVGENKGITESDIGTGEVTLQAKKLAVLIKAPNELIRFASPAAEALMRDDMTKSLALGLDLAGLEGEGTDTQPLGIINHPNINTLTSSDTAAGNGHRMVGQDIYRFPAIVEESNAEFSGWIMRPKTMYKYYQLRADAVAQGDGSGMFLFDAIREPGAGTKAQLAGYPVTTSTQVSQVRTNGSNTACTYILGGQWDEVLMGMFGAVEFAATALGDTAFTNDQTWVRGILSADIQLRHEVAFVLMDNLDTTL